MEIVWEWATGKRVCPLTVVDTPEHAESSLDVLLHMYQLTAASGGHIYIQLNL